MPLLQFLATSQPYQPQTQTILCHDGTYLPVTVVGTGEPVVLLHAFGMDARHFLPFILPLASRFCFYLPHFRGYGLAKHLATTQLDFIEQYADDVNTLLTQVCQQHGVNAVVMGGFSMGALVAWAHFNRYLQPDKPQTNEGARAISLKNDTDITAEQQLSQPLSRTHKVKRYLNIDQAPVIHHQPDYQGGVFGEEQAKIFGEFAKVLAATLPYVNSDSGLENSTHNNADTRIDTSSSLPSSSSLLSSKTAAGLAKPLTATVTFAHLPYAVKRQIVATERAFSLLSLNRHPMRWLANITGYHTPYRLSRYHHPTWQQKMRCLQAYIELPYDYRAGLEQLTIPVTFIVGAKSKLYDPIWQRAIAAKLPHAAVFEVPNAGHAVPVDAPLQFADLLKRFLLS